jgi:hypothetical protein
MRNILKPFWLVLALLFLFEAWAFERFRALGQWIVARLPLQRVKTVLQAGIAQLPPIATLVLFSIPVLVIIPFKFAGLWLIAHRHVVLGAGVFLAAKFVGLAVTAFLFDLCRDKLMQMTWFVRFYDMVLRLKQWADDRVEPFRQGAKAAISPILLALRAPLASIGHDGRGTLERKILAVRRWARARTERA